MVGSIAAFLIAQLIVLYTFTVNVQITKRIEMVKMGKELSQHFFDEDDKLFQNIRTTIESCGGLYRGYKKGGKFSHDEINRYLGFFDDLGFYYRIQALDLNIIDQFFGAYIVEAHHNNEVSQYVTDLQRNAKQKTALADFQALANALERVSDRRDLAEEYRSRCNKLDNK
jgi:hypothetical protein